MAGVWYFKDGVAKLVASRSHMFTRSPRKILVHCSSKEMITNFEQLDEKLPGFGWHPYYGDYVTHAAMSPAFLYFGLPDSAPSVNNLRTVHMYDTVVKTRSTFQVRDAAKFQF